MSVSPASGSLSVYVAPENLLIKEKLFKENLPRAVVESYVDPFLEEAPDGLYCFPAGVGEDWKKDVVDPLMTWFLQNTPGSGITAVDIKTWLEKGIE